MPRTKRGILKRMADIVNPYSWITATRNRLFDMGIIESKEFAIPTICIGNISVGGTGKTPHTEYLVKTLKDKYKTAVLSRGYGRKSKGYIMATCNTPASLIGDEPFQIKQKFKDIDVAVCERRTIGIKKITSEIKETEVILLDDAFQHRHLKAGLNILLIDSTRPIWNDSILPFGCLRESAKGIRRADIVIFTKCKEEFTEQSELYRDYIKRMKDIPVFLSRMKYGELYPLAGKKKKDIDNCYNILLVAGIANPRPLKEEIEKRGAKVTLMQYADHHNFKASDFTEIGRQYTNMEGEKKMIVTTEKDAARIMDHPALSATIKENIHILPIEVEILEKKENMFNKMILDYVTENSRNRRIP